MTSVLASFSSQALFTQRFASIANASSVDTEFPLSQRQAGGVLVSLTETRVSSTETVITRGLGNGLGVDLPAEPATDPESPLFDVDKVVDTVLDFIGTRIGAAQQAGASDSELGGLFDAARQGVEQGFSQARGDLRSFGRTEESLFERVDEAEIGINQGIDELEEDVFAPSDDTDDEISVDLPVSATSSSLNTFERNTERFSFDLTTRDGDRVTIFAVSDQGSQSSLSSTSNSSGTELSASESTFSAFGFSLSVEGDLDEGEQLAIAELLAQVDEISQEFYSGNIGAAFELALQVTSDPAEIASFSLNLQQTQVSVVEATYQQSSGASGLPRGIAEPLAEFASRISESYGLAAQFNDARGLLETLFDRLDTQNAVADVIAPFLNVLDA